MTEQLLLIAEAEDGGKRADAFLASRLEELSRSAIQKRIAAGDVYLNDDPCEKNTLVKPGDRFLVTLPEPAPDRAVPQNMPLEIVYEDQELLVVNKPKGMCVHPAPGNPDGTLVNALLYHCQGRLSGINGVMRPGIVHRIDKDTSGLLLVAKTDRAHASLAAQIAAHSLERCYEAVVYGALQPVQGRIDRPIARSTRDRKKMAVCPKGEGRNAQTRYETLGIYELQNQKLSHMRFVLETGRTHQIRVHCASVGHPVVGDGVYGDGMRNGRLFPGLVGQCLHARTVGFDHPVTGERMTFTSSLPEYFEKVLTKLQKSGIIREN